MLDFFVVKSVDREHRGRIHREFVVGARFPLIFEDVLHDFVIIGSAQRHVLDRSPHRIHHSFEFHSGIVDRVDGHIGNKTHREVDVLRPGRFNLEIDKLNLRHTHTVGVLLLLLFFFLLRSYFFIDKSESIDTRRELLQGVGAQERGT